MTTIYILVKERFAFSPNKTYIMDVGKDWNKICNIRKKLIQTIIEKGDPWFEEILPNHNISELEVIECSDYIHQVRVKKFPAVGIEFRIIEQQLED